MSPKKRRSFDDLVRWCGILSISVLAVITGVALADFAYSYVFFSHREGYMTKIRKIADYQGYPWVEQLISDSEGSSHFRIKFTPFVGWRRPPFQSPTVNVDGKGRRATPNADCRPGSFKLFLYGGSTVWGTGSPDSMTISGHLQRILESRFGGRLCVVNLGETGWNTNQEIVQLVSNLRSGEVPDLAVFYDGLNDQTVSMKYLDTETYDKFDVITERMDQRGPSLRDLLGMVVPTLLLKFRKSDFTWVGRIPPPDLTEKILSTYEGNMKIARALARSYGFKVHTFWQSSIFHAGRHLTPEEQEILAPFPASHTRFLREFKPQFRGKYNDFDDISDALNDEKGQVWIDDRHVTPKGNLMIAQSIIRVLDRRHLLRGFPGR